MITVDINKLIKQYGYVKSFVIIVLLIVLLIVVRINSNFDFSQDDSSITNQNYNGTVLDAHDVPREQRFWESVEQWETKGWRIDSKKELMCAKGKFTYYLGSQYLSSVPVTLNSYSFSYEANYINENIAPVMIRLGTKFIDLYIHEGNPELIGKLTSKLSAGGDLEFSSDKPLELSLPPQNSTEVEISVKYIESQGRELIYLLSVKYYTHENPFPITDTFTINTVSSDPSQNSSIKVAFGTKQGECISPRSYKIVP